MELNKVYSGDCLEVMKDIPDKSIDMILCDLPYGTTACSWDRIIPFEPLWEQYKRIIKDNGAIVLSANEPFATLLRMSNMKEYKYDWIWNKNRGGNFVSANYQPMKVHEVICVFGKFPITFNPKKIKNYNPQMDKGKPYSRGKIRNVNWNGSDVKTGGFHNNFEGLRFPQSIINISNKNNNSLHPTQKPVALFEYLIKTYSNKGDLVLDNCIGSGTTAVACINTNRNFIGMELEQKYVDIANKRIEETLKQTKLEVKQEAMQSEARHSSQP